MNIQRLSMTSLGRLTQVPLRSAWESEASHFTPWLAQPENISILGDAIGIQLEVEAEEKDVGPFRADILCKDTTTDAWVLIENQLDKTDHKHLGQIITYASGLEAVVIIWIAEKFTDEHRGALDWLNQLASKKLQCFGIEIELLRIDDSPPAPRFNVVARPNDWTRGVSTGANQLEDSDITPGKRQQVDFWNDFAAFLRMQKTALKPRKSAPRHWMDFALGRAGIHLSAVFSNTDKSDQNAGGEVRAEVLIKDASRGPTWYKQLEGEHESIEREFGEPLQWIQNPDAVQRKIFVRLSADVSNRVEWPRLHSWLFEKLDRLYLVFADRVRRLP